MITGDPVPDLKIITHPALLDTATGCRAVMIDRFADKATSSATYRGQAQSLVDTSHALYKLAWGLAVQRRLANAADLGDGDKKAISNIAAAAVRSGQAGVAAGYAGLRVATQASASLPVTAKPAFYDAQLVQQARQCVAGSEQVDALKACLAKGSVGATSRLDAARPLMKRARICQQNPGCPRECNNIIGDLY